MMSDPNTQAKMDEGQNSRDGRRTPAQRIARAAAYMGRMSAATGGAKP